LADDVVLGSIGSTSLSKPIWNQYLCVSLIMDRDIFHCQKMQKVMSGVVLHMDSYDLHPIRFFDKNELESRFYSWSFVVSFSSNGLFSRFQRWVRPAISYAIVIRNIQIPDLSAVTFVWHSFMPHTIKSSRNRLFSFPSLVHVPQHHFCCDSYPKRKVGWWIVLALRP
jgi:hypothetical protein